MAPENPYKFKNSPKDFNSIAGKPGDSIKALNLTDTFDSEGLKVETYDNGNRKVESVATPFIGEKIANRVNSLRQQADKVIGNFTAKTGEVIGTLAARGSSSFAKAMEDWKKDMEVARAEKALTAESIPEQKIVAETADAEAEASVETAKEKTSAINGNEALQRVTDGRYAVREGINKTLKAGLERFNLLKFLKEAAAMLFKKAIRGAKIMALKALGGTLDGAENIAKRSLGNIEGWQNKLRKVTTYENLQRMSASPVAPAAPETAAAETTSAPETPAPATAENVIDLASERSERESVPATSEAPATQTESIVQENNVWGLNENYVKPEEVHEEFKEAA